MKGVVYPEVEYEIPDFVIWSPYDLEELAELREIARIEAALNASCRKKEEALK